MTNVILSAAGLIGRRSRRTLQRRFARLPCQGILTRNVIPKECHRRERGFKKNERAQLGARPGSGVQL